jgi:hypothetical protein
LTLIGIAMMIDCNTLLLNVIKKGDRDWKMKMQPSKQMVYE